jgi:proteasome accessory factor C
MAKFQTNPVEKAARLLDLVPYITTHQGIPLQELAENFGLSRDEMLNDLNTLWMCGLPGYTPLELIDLEFESGFVTIRNAEILQRVRLLSKQELVVILLGLDILRTSLPSDRNDLVSSVDRLTGKIRQIVGEIATAKPIVDSHLRAVINRGISSRKDLQILYYSAIRDEENSRKITPIDIQVDQGFEVLNAYCHFAQGFRTFRLDNLRSVELVTDTTAIPQREADQEFSWDIRIVNRFRSALERFRLTQSVEKTNESIDVSVKSFSQDWLLRSALSALESVEVIGAKTARENIAAKCAKTLTLYEKLGLK